MIGAGRVAGEGTAEAAAAAVAQASEVAGNDAAGDEDWASAHDTIVRLSAHAPRSTIESAIERLDEAPAPVIFPYASFLGEFLQMRPN